MVKKLFKHEFFAFARMMSIVYAILLSVAAAGRVVQCFANDSVAYTIVRTFSDITYGVSVAAALGAWFVFTLVRFYKHLFTSEGYLTFTLPVTPTAHIAAKSITALYFGIITVVVMLLSGCVITAGELLVEIFKAAGYIVHACYVRMHYQLFILVVECMVLLVAVLFTTVLLYCTFIAVGQLFKKNRILAAVGAYFVYYLLTQVVSAIVLVAFSIFATTPAMEKVARFILEHPYASAHIGIWGLIVLNGAIAAACFFGIRHIITKKLNLE